jgi:hypothetical protein
VVAPGPIRALIGALALQLADRSGPAGASGARRSAAAAALRNAAPLSGSLDAELTALMTGAPRTGVDLDSAVNSRAAARLAAHAAQAERLRVAIGAEGAVATGPGLGATSWGDLAPAHEAIRRSGRSELLIAAGPSVARGGRTSLGGIDAADAVRAGLAPTLLADVLLASRLVRGDIDTLLLASDLVAADGSAVVAVGGVALAVAARAGGARVILVAPGRDPAEAHTAPTDAAALERRIADSMRSPGTTATASREAAAGVATEGSRVEVLTAALIDAAP